MLRRATLWFLRTSRQFSTTSKRHGLTQRALDSRALYVPAAVAVSEIPSGASIFVHGNASTPTELLTALCEHVNQQNLRGIRLHHIMLHGPLPWVESKFQDRIRSNCLFVCDGMRKSVAAGAADYVPVFLSDTTRLFEEGIISLDYAFLTVSKPDEHGFCSLGTSVDCALSAMRNAKKVIALVNPTMPRTFGDGAAVHISNFDSMTETDRPIYEKPTRVCPEAKRIGEIIARNLVDDGATLQLGEEGERKE